MCTVCPSLGLCVDPISTFTPLNLLPAPDSQPLFSPANRPQAGALCQMTPEPQPWAVLFSRCGLGLARKLGSQVAFLGPDWVVAHPGTFRPPRLQR